VPLPSAEEAEGLGTCLFDAALPARLQVMCAHILRVRYETKEEWVGLLRAQQATLVHAEVNKGKEREWRVVQVPLLTLLHTCHVISSYV